MCFKKKIDLDISSDYKIEIDQIKKEEWDNLLLKFNDATIYQTWSYGAIHWSENNISHLILKIKNEVIGLAQIGLKKIPGFKLTVATINWGPVWKKKDSTVSLKNLDILLKALKNEYIFNRGFILRIRPYEIKKPEIFKIYIKNGFKLNNNLRIYRSLRLNLEPLVEDLRMNLLQKWRNCLNKVEKYKLEVIEGDDDKLYDIYMKLVDEMSIRKKLVTNLNYEEFRDIQKNLPGNLKMRILICKHNNIPVSASIFSYIGDTGLYLLGATGDEGIKVNGSYLLHWEAIKRLKKLGAKWYDLGGINPKKTPGVYKFKKGIIGKQDGEFFHVGTFDSYSNIISLFIIKLIDKLINVKSKLRKFNKTFKKKYS